MYFFFCLDAKEKVPKRKNQDCIFLTTTVFRFAKEKELASLKQLFLFNATLHTYALRQKNEVGCHADKGVYHVGMID